MANIFVYGTLIFPEVVLKLTGKSFQTKDAILKGYKRCKIFDQHTPRRYPAIIESNNDFVKGKILFDVDEESLKVLDFFEDNDYIRKEEIVFIGKKEFLTYVYVWNPKLKEKLMKKWSPEEFQQKHLRDYLEKVIPEYLYKYGRQK